jgi:hypothetical protein
MGGKTMDSLRGTIARIIAECDTPACRESIRAFDEAQRAKPGLNWKPFTWADYVSVQVWTAIEDAEGDEDESLDD